MPWPDCFPGECELATAYALWHREDASPSVREFIAALTGPEGRAEFAAEGLTPPAAQ